MKHLAPEHLQLLSAAVTCRGLLRKIIQTLPATDPAREVACRAAGVLMSAMKGSPQRMRYRAVGGRAQ